VVPNAIIHLALMASIAFGILWAKKGLTHSRIGLVKFGDKAKQRTKVAFLVSFITVFLTSLVWVLSTNGYFLPKSSWLGQYGFDILIAVVILVLFSALAYSLNIIRFYLYGVLFAASIPLQVFLPRLKWFPLIASGIIITAIGVYLLIQFLKGFPAVDAEMDGGEEVAHE